MGMHLHRGGCLRAYTLVELLVVLGIITVLIGLLMPAVSKARAHAKQVRCMSHLQANGRALQAHAIQNGGRYPSDRLWMWYWDLSYPIRDAMLESGATRETMYCPFNPGQNTDAMWNWQPYTVTGYFWLAGREGHPKNISGYGSRSPSEVELICDATLSKNGKFAAIPGGHVEAHSSNHLGRENQPLGGFIFFADGHVAWRPHAEMKKTQNEPVIGVTMFY